MKVTVLFSLMLISGRLLAQNSIDLVTASFRHGFPQRTVEEAGEATENVFLVNLKVPVVFSETTIWYSDLTYQSSVVNYTGEPTNTIDPTRLHGYILQTGLVQQLTDRSAIQLLLVPRLMTDFRDINSSHFQFGGIGLFERKYHERLTMRYGLMYNREQFGNMFVPLVYIDWQLSARWSVNGLLPIFAKIKYQANERLSLGLSHFGLITSYQTGNPAFDGDYIERKSIDLTSFVRYRLLGNLCFETRAGYALGRSYLQFAKGDEMDFRVAIFSFGDDRVQKNVSFDSGPIVDFRLVYNLPVK